MGIGTKLMRNQSGFTLIELMVVVVVVAILMAVALPAYQNQVIRGHRSAAKAEMLEIANREQQYLLSNRSYTKFKVDGGELIYTTPPDVAAFYTFSISTVSTSGVPEFSIRAEPLGNQARDGWLQVDSQGNKTSQFSDKWSR